MDICGVNLWRIDVTKNESDSQGSCFLSFVVKRSFFENCDFGALCTTEDIKLYHPLLAEIL